MLSRIYLFLLSFMIVAMGVVSSSWALDIKDMRFGVHPDKTRLVLDMDQYADFRTFVLKDPLRLVIDLPQTNWGNSVFSTKRPSSVLDVRHGALAPSYSRIVLDLKNPVLLKDAFVLPGNSTKPYRLVIDYQDVSASVFAAAPRQIKGNLSMSGATSGAVQQTSVTPSRIPQAEPSASSAPSVPAVPEKPLIILDPGHGGIDPGAIGANGAFEKNIVLAIAREVKRQLEDSGRYRVMMTRNSDVFIRLRDRVAYARKHKADFFMSLHADTIKKSNVRGASVYTLSEKSSDKQTELLAQRENRADLIAGIDLTHEDHDVASILVDLAMRDTMNQSKFFANTLVEKLEAQQIRTLQNPHRYAGFAVLKAPDIPSVLVELGFLSNRSEAILLSQSDYRQKMAASLVAGIDAYFEKLRRNQRI